MGAFKRTRAKESTIDEAASKLEKRPEVRTRIDDLLRSMKALDFDSQSKAYQDLLAAIEAATQQRNYTAVASLQRLRMDHLGMLRSAGVGSSLSSISDESLIEKLAGQNVELRRQLATLLGSTSFAGVEDSTPRGNA